jgi:Domain of unknown function (DUF5753)
MMVSTLDNVSIGVIPFSAEADTAYLHGFSIHDEGDVGDEAFVLLETVHAWLTVSAADDLTLYDNQWSTLRKAALTGDEARDFLGALSAEMRAMEA